MEQGGATSDAGAMTHMVPVATSDSKRGRMMQVGPDKFLHITHG
jgi:hypothetical protein